VLDSSMTTKQNSNGGRGRGRFARQATEAPKRRAEPAEAADTNQLLGQFATYSSLCGGSAAASTDGEFFATSAGERCCGREQGCLLKPAKKRAADRSCDDQTQLHLNSPRWQAVRRRRQVRPDGAGAASQGPDVRWRFSCGTLADAADAACMEGGTVFRERQCDTLGAPVAARAAAVVREAPCTSMDAAHFAAVGPTKVRFLTRSGWRQRKAAAPAYAFGSVILTEVKPLGRPVAVAIVLLGQAASSTRQCHERPTCLPLGQHGTQFPPMTGSRVFDTGSEHAIV
jgi:hypothetical protein